MGFFFQRTELWTLTWQGWIVAAIALGLGFMVSIRWIYPFLAVSRPIPTVDVAVVEGWIPDDVLKTLVADLQHYPVVITTGHPVHYGRYLTGYDSFSEVAADSLMLFGLPSDAVTPIPSTWVKRNRTFSSAIAVRDWLLQTHPDIQAVNLYSMGPHARRSWLIFRRVLHPIQVGIHTAAPPDYEPQQWWQSSSGTRTVLAEAISYLYASLVTWTR